MPPSPETLFEQVCDHARQTALLASVEGLLGWDERTMMPPAAAPHRAEQMTLLSAMIHRRTTDPRFGGWLEELAASERAADPHGDMGATVRGLKRIHDRAVRLPTALVEELTRTAVLGQQAWEEARERDDFGRFQPLLEKTVRLKREEADALAIGRCRYDALLDEYEPGESTDRVAAVLAGLREPLVALIDAIRGASQRPDAAVLKHRFPLAAQEALGRAAAAEIGFDFSRGRLDETVHPFCAEAGPHDCRITTRYDEHYLPMGLFGILHEAGHGLYDQGLDPAAYGLPLGSPVSHGIHESQSRLWENQVGRSRAFWEHGFSRLKQFFPAALTGVSLDDFHFAVNAVAPSTIRVEADEATYNLHIIVRFELEQALLEDRLAVADLPAAWNAAYREYLDIEVPNDAQGVLQDVHWSGGSFGYFPTYTLGNLYAAAFFAAADAALGGLEALLARGEFQPLLDWLRENVHGHGQRFSAAELIMRITGAPLSHAPFMDYLRGKLTPLYRI